VIGTLPGAVNGRRGLAAALAERARRYHGLGNTRYESGEARLDLLMWTITRRPLLKVGAAFDLVRHPYLVDLYREQAKVVVVFKASQMGASEWAISYALHAADERGMTMLYVFPTDVHVSDFSAARIGPAIEASPYLDGIIVEGGAGEGKRGADRVTLKRVRDRFVYLRGAKVAPDGKAPQLKAIDADGLILDEVDEMDPRAAAIAVKRLGHSEVAEERWISTPTYAGVGIHAKWGESDQREWFVRCMCGEWQGLSIHQVVTEWDQLERPVEWHGKEEGRAWVACQKCGAEVNRLGAGEWVAGWPGRDVVGYHLSKLFSPAVTVLQLVTGLQTVDETKRREAFNQDLGQPYTPRGGRLNEEVLDKCRREYGHGPVEGERPVMGVDVGRVMYGVIRSQADEETGERVQRWAGEIESWEGLAHLVKQYDVATLVIDALPETSKARELQAAFSRGRVYLAYYVTQKVGSKRAEPMQWDEDQGVVNLDRTRALDLTMARFFGGENTLPLYARDVAGYYEMMQAVVRVIEDGPGGEKVARYVEAGPDHFCHAENYCAVASLAPEVWDGLGWA